ncbi:MAG: RICIN domain-containing protein [Bacteroidales bacterium]|nr:RICIN domain-containing protein [Candidatus Colimorpha merdihippi]
MTRIDKFCESMYKWCCTMDMHYGQGNNSFPLPRYDFTYGGSTDCSAMVAHCLNEAGWEVPKTIWSGNTRAALEEQDWKVSFDDGLPPRGAVLVNYQNHVGMWDGTHIIEFGGDPHYGYSTYHGWYDYPWDCYMVPPAEKEDEEPEEDMSKVVQLWPSNGATSQKYNLHKFADDTNGIKVMKSGKYLDVSGSEYKQGTPVIAWRSTSGENQRFVIKDRGDGMVSIHPKAAPELCLDVRGGEGNIRDRIILWTYREQRNQLWHKCVNADGTVTFLTALDAKLALDVVNGGVPE